MLMLDAIGGIVEQDRALAERIADEGRACIICLNKWDIVPNKDDKTYIAAIENIRSNLPELRWAEVCLLHIISSLSSYIFSRFEHIYKQ